MAEQSQGRVEWRPRLSHLFDAGALPSRGLPPRTAVVAFSAGAVYDLAERLRVRWGGAAVVLGALCRAGVRVDESGYFTCMSGLGGSAMLLPM